MKKASNPSIESLREMPEVVGNPRFVRVGPRGMMARKMGRPRKGEAARETVPATVRLPKSVLAHLARIAHANGVSLGSVLRFAVESYARNVAP